MRRISWSKAFLAFPLVVVLATVLGWQFYRTLEEEIVTRFSSHQWEVPSKIYAEPVLLYPGARLEAGKLFALLTRLDYRAVNGLPKARGEYLYDQKTGILQLALRASPLPQIVTRAQRVSLLLRGEQIERLIDLDNGDTLPFVELDPEVIASVYDRSWGERRVVKLYEVPSQLVKALLAAEDHRFFEHEGVDLWRILGAVRANLLARRPVQGGSTLTQQLVKNFFLSQEKTVQRKLVEICMAAIVEMHYSKLEILENYLNEIYLGQNGAKGIFGMWEAARVYFGKEPRDLTLGESAILAGMVKSPNTYSPLRHADRIIPRRNYVLQRMLELGHISSEEYEAALKETVAPRTLPPEDNIAPHFADFIRKALTEQFPDNTLATAGLRVSTSLDLRLQAAAFLAVQKGLQELEKRYPRLQRSVPEEQLQACLIAMQPQTGAIRAMIGGRDYQSSQFNRATQAHRQLGSVFKPIVFLTALSQEREKREGRFLPSSRIDDTPFTWSYKGESWSPGNYNNQYLGPVSLRRALELSLNAATARLAQEVGLDAIRQTAENVGFVSPLPQYPSLVLGSGEVTPFEVAVAFSTLANNGVRTVPRPIKLVSSQNGETLAQQEIAMEQVIPAADAYMVTHLLEGVLTRGTGRAARAQGFTSPAAGKTGTTNDYGDAWFVGYTPDLVTVVWVGFDQRQSLGLSGAQAALPIWTAFMKRVTANQPPAAFIPPPGVTVVPIDPQTGERATAQCPIVLDEAFYEGEEPQYACSRHGGGIVPVETHSERKNDRREREEQFDDQPGSGRRSILPQRKEKPWWQIF
jgi:penicillin-binding protein 1B